MPTAAPSSSSTSLARIWAWPVALALLSTSGLISALVSDAAGDVWAWLALGLPLAVMGWHGLGLSPAARRAPRC